MKALTSLFLLAYSISISAQGPGTIVYKGVLANEDGHALMMKKGTIEFTLLDKKGSEVSRYETKFESDSTGSFYYGMLDIPAIFSSDETNDELSIKLVLKAEKGNDWMETDELKMSFTLEKVLLGKYVEYKITRKEGLQIMNHSYQQPVWKFSDRYPFMYLHSTFMISFSKELTSPEKIVEICNKMEGGTKDKPANSRGIKGGYAVGGYNRN